MDILLIILLFLLAFIGVTLYVLLRRALLNIEERDAAINSLTQTQVELTESNASFERWFDEFKKRTMESYGRIKSIDASGHFEADDEVGYFFTELKSTIERLYELGIIDEAEKTTNTETSTGAPKLTAEKLQEILAQRAAIGAIGRDTSPTAEEKG